MNQVTEWKNAWAQMDEGDCYTDTEIGGKIKVNSEAYLHAYINVWQYDTFWNLQ